MVTLLFFACAASPSKPSGEENAAPEIDLSDALAALVAQNDGYGGGLVQVAGGAQGSAAAGEAWMNGPDMAVEDSFEIASISKTFTAATVLRLMEQGAFELDTPLGDLLDSSWTDGLLVVKGTNLAPEITLRELLQHTSGLPDYWSDPPYESPGTNAFLTAFEADTDHLWTPEELIGYAKDLNPIDAPGETWHYSDTNYVLLGVLIEQTTGERLEDAYRDLIYEPLDLSQTWLSYHEDPPADAPSESHRYEGHQDLVGRTNQSADWAGGGLVSTAPELAALLTGLAEGRLYDDPATLDAMLETVPTDTEDVSYGLGLFVVDLGEDGEVWGHEGWGSSFAWWWPEQQIALTGTINQTKTDHWPLVEAMVGEVDAGR